MQLVFIILHLRNCQKRFRTRALCCVQVKRSTVLKSGFPGDLMNHVVKSFKPEVLMHNPGYPRNIIHHEFYRKNNQRFIQITE
jgi:hypothetical protein